MKKSQKKVTGPSFYESLADSINGHSRWRPRKISNKQQLPQSAVEDCIYGLLAYFSIPARRRKSERIHLDTLGSCVVDWLASVVLTTDRKFIQNVDIIQAMPGVISMLVHEHPSRFILKHESQWFDLMLNDYAILKNDSPDRRLYWLQHNVQSLLIRLNEITRCPRTDCRRQMIPPPAATLEKWTRRSGVRDLQLEIMAYYHGVSVATVTRYYYRKVYSR